MKMKYMPPIVDILKERSEIISYFGYNKAQVIFDVKQLLQVEVVYEKTWLWLVFMKIKI